MYQARDQYYSTTRTPNLSLASSRSQGPGNYYAQSWGSEIPPRFGSDPSGRHITGNSSVTSFSLHGATKGFVSQPTKTSGYKVPASNTQDINSLTGVSAQIGATNPDALGNQCWACKETRAYVQERTAYAWHDNNLQVFGPCPQDVEPALGNKLEWTLCKVHCKACQLVYQVYRYHLVSYDIWSYSLEDVELGLRNLAYRMKDIFEASRQSAQTAMGQVQNDRQRYISRSPQDSGIPTQAVWHKKPRKLRPKADANTHGPQASGLQASVHNPLSQTNDATLPLDFLDQASTQPYAARGLLESYPYMSAGPQQQQPCYLDQGPDIGIPGFLVEGEQSPRHAESNTRDESSISSRAPKVPRNMNQKLYALNRKKGTCEFSKQRHAACICNRGVRTCREERQLKDQQRYSTGGVGASGVETTTESVFGQEYFDYDEASLHAMNTAPDDDGNSPTRSNKSRGKNRASNRSHRRQGSQA